MQPRKYHYIQDWGSYPGQTLVTVGMNQSDITKTLVKVRAKVDFIEAYLRLSETTNFDNPACVYLYRGKSILRLKQWSGSVDDLGTLVHETNHLIYDLMGRAKGMADEPEAQAYQQDYLFTNILLNLKKHYGKHLPSRKTKESKHERIPEVLGSPQHASSLAKDCYS